MSPLANRNTSTGTPSGGGSLPFVWEGGTVPLSGTDDIIRKQTTGEKGDENKNNTNIGSVMSLKDATIPETGLLDEQVESYKKSYKKVFSTIYSTI